MQLPLWAPESEWRPPELSELPSWSGVKRISIDTETRDPHLKQLGIGVRRDGHVVGVSFAIEDGPKFYLPFRHEGGDNLPEEAVLRYLRENAKRFDGYLVGANISYDLDYLLEEGVDFSSMTRIRDVQIADPLIYELHKSFSLQNIANRWDLPGKSEDLLNEAAKAFGVGAKDGMWKLPARYVGLYAEDDADLPLKILRKQERVIDEQDLWGIYDLESDVIPVLVRMRRRGVRVNMEKLAKIEEWTLEQEREALEIVKRATGFAIGVGNVWKAAAIAPALEQIGVRLHKTSTGQPSIDKELLSTIDHPVAKAIAWARKTNKLRTTFAESVRRYQINGRIHCSFNQIAMETEGGDQKGARYGRLSCVEPNLQQQPARDEFASMWRSIYEPEEGALWSCNDYSQQEPRWTTHFAAVTDLPKAREAAVAYHENPDLDNHQFMADLTELPRKHAKQIYLGLCYGEGGAKLCRELGLPTRWALSSGRGRERRIQYFNSRDEVLQAKRELPEGGFVWEAAGEEGQRILDTFDDRAPFIRKLAKNVERRAKQRGFITTVMGRRLHFPENNDGTFDWTHKALNRLIQGSSADQTKKAIVEIDRAGHHLMLQVHDETDNSVGSEREAREIGTIMQDVLQAEVPFKVDTEIGPNWGEIK